MAFSLRSWIATKLMLADYDLTTFITVAASTGLLAVTIFSIAENARQAKMLADEEVEQFPMQPQPADLQKYAIVELEEHRYCTRYLAGVIRQQLSSGSLSRVVIVVGPSTPFSSAMVRQSLVPMTFGSKDGVPVLTPIGAINQSGWPVAWLPTQRINMSNSTAWLDSRMWVTRVATGMAGKGPLTHLKSLLTAITSGVPQEDTDVFQQLLGPAPMEDADDAVVQSRILGGLAAALQLAIRNTAIFRGLGQLSTTFVDPDTQETTACSSFVLQKEPRGGILFFDGCDRLGHLARTNALGQQCLALFCQHLVDVTRLSDPPTMSHSSLPAKFFQWLYGVKPPKRSDFARSVVMVADDALLLRDLLPLVAREGIQVISFGDLSKPAAKLYYEARLLGAMGRVVNGMYQVPSNLENYYRDALEAFPQVFDLVGGRIPDIVSLVHHLASNVTSAETHNVPLKDVIYTFPDITACGRFIEPVLFSAQGQESDLSTLWAPWPQQVKWDPQWTRTEVVNVFKELLKSPNGVVPWVDIVRKSHEGEDGEVTDPSAVVSLVTHGVLWYRPAGPVYFDVPEEKGESCPLTNINATRDCVTWKRPIFRFVVKKLLKRYGFLDQ